VKEISIVSNLPSALLYSQNHGELKCGDKGVVCGPEDTHVDDACALIKTGNAKPYAIHVHATVPGQRVYGCHAKAKSGFPKL
jgi:hypothetical protein